MTQSTEQPGPCPREASRRPQPAWRPQETMCNCGLPGAPAWLELRGREGPHHPDCSWRKCSWECQHPRAAEAEPEELSALQQQTFRTPTPTSQQGVLPPRPLPASRAAEVTRLLAPAPQSPPPSSLGLLPVCLCHFSGQVVLN